jgi:uncharacterized protein DUF2867
MKVPNTEHTSRPWRIHELTGDFRLEDVWALDTPGGPDDLPRLVQQFVSGGDGSDETCGPQVLWAIRWKVGEVLGWDDPRHGPGAGTPTLRDRLPADLREAGPGPDLDGFLFRPLYLLRDEWAGELANRTVHAVLHLGWVPDGDGRYHGQMAVLVRPNGVLGQGYMVAIKPFRHLFIYPSLLRQIESGWAAASATPRP